MTAAFVLLGVDPLVLLAYSSDRIGDETVRAQVNDRLVEASSAAATLVEQQMLDLKVLVQSYADREGFIAAMGGGTRRAPTRPTSPGG